MKRRFKSLLGFLLILTLFSSCKRTEIEQPVTDETYTYEAGSFSMKVNGELWKADSATVSVGKQTPLDKGQDTMLIIRIRADKEIDGGNELFQIIRIVSKEEFENPTRGFSLNNSNSSTLAYFSKIIIGGENAPGNKFGSLVFEAVGHGKVVIDRFKIGALENVGEGKVGDLQTYIMLHGTFEMETFQYKGILSDYPDPSETDSRSKFIFTEGKFNATGVPAY